MSGLLAIAFGALNLYHEGHLKEVDGRYLAVATTLGAIWLGSVVLAFRGVKVGLVLTAAIAFLEFGVISSSHFVTGPTGMSTYAKSEGLSVAPISMTLLSLCLLTFMTAIVCWSHPTGHRRPIRALPLLLTSLVGATLVILYATDSVRRDDFGTASTEDGTFAASVSATFWLFGGLWFGRMPKTGALLIGLGTFMATFSFIALHVVKGGHTLGDIAAKSGPFWASVAAAMAGLAALSLVVALTILVRSLLLQRRPSPQSGKRVPSAL
ncbi:MAG: hypothetical protein PVSMB9_10390 [Candidatus Dormibacteria bacterium]